MAESRAHPRASRSEITRLEALGRRGWPALEVERADGWLLGSSGRYTRRANSIGPVEPGELDLAEKLSRAEAHYAARDRPVVFKMTDVAEPAGLDDVLDARGYIRRSETIVQVLAPIPIRRGDGVSSTSTVAGVQVIRCENDVPADWFAASAAHSNVSSDQRADYRALLRNVIASAHAVYCGSLERESRIVSVAMGCVVGEALSIVQVATAPEVRGERLAESVLRALLEQGRAQGAHTGLLSVEVANASARRLYARLGFVERYRYWYREGPT